MAEVVTALVAGVVLGAWGSWLARRNEKKAATERLLVEALNDLVGGIADVAAKVPYAQARYASALARVGLHGSLGIVQAFRRHQDDATTITAEGRQLLVDAVQQARRELRQQHVADDALSVLLFGTGKPVSSDRTER